MANSETGRTNETIITRVLVGSRLHGVHNDNSDYDWRGIHISPLRNLISPFAKTANTTWIEGDQDNTSYELNEFTKLATHGNATILEVFFSDQIAESSPTADIMRANWQRFIDTDKFVMASRGYAQNQFNKMSLFEPDARTPKFAVAYLRVLWQCAVFLETSVFSCKVTDNELRDYMKVLRETEFTADRIPDLTERFMAMQARVSKAWATCDKMRPDIPWIENFLLQAYTTQS